MAFTNAQLVDIRRFCGYPTYGSQYTPASGYRFATQYGVLEYKMANLQAEEQAVVITTYLTDLYILEAAIPTAAANLDTDSASVWFHNKKEIKDRTDLFNQWRLALCEFLGVPPGGMLAGGGNSVSLVV